MAGSSAAPRTRYASCGEIDIAYQVFGDGPIDLLVLPGPLIPIDCVDLEPPMYREAALKGVPGQWRLYSLVREHAVVRR